MSPDSSMAGSIRRQARAWLAAVRPGRDNAGPRAFLAGGARILVLESGRLTGGQVIEGCLLVRGDLVCGPGCSFRGPVYVAGHVELGKNSAALSLECDGDLRLGSGAEVLEFAVATGSMELRAGSRVHGEARSEASIRLGPGASGRDLLAPLVATGAPEVDVEQPLRRAGDTGPGVVLPPPGEPFSAAMLFAAGIEISRLRPDGSGGWLYHGDLLLQRPVILKSPLRVTGSIGCFDGSLIEADLRAGGSVALGARCVSRGTLTSGGDMSLGPGCVFQRDLCCRQMMRLESGVRGLRSGAPVSVWANGELTVGPDVKIRGRIASACRVVTEQPAPAARLPVAVMRMR